MQPTQYKLRLYTATHTLLNEYLNGQAGDPSRVEYAVVDKEAGALVAEFPASEPKSWFAFDNYFEVLVSVDGRPFQIDFEKRWFILKTELFLKDSIFRWRVTALDCNWRLRNRIVAGYAVKDEPPPTPLINNLTNYFGAKSGPGDDMMKQVVRDNTGVTSPAYGIAGIPPNRALREFAVDPNASKAPTTQMKFAHRQMLDALKEICKNVAEGTTKAWLSFDVSWDGTSDTFRTYVGQRGIDRRGALTLSQENAIGDGTYSEDFTDAFTVVYAGGEGQKNIRNMAVRFDSIRTGQTPNSWIERFADAKDKSGLGWLEKDAEARLKEGRPKFSLSVNLAQSDALLFRRDYGYGDMLSVEFGPVQADMRIAAARVVLEGGAEKVTIGMQASDYLGGSGDFLGTHMLTQSNDAGVFAVLRRVAELEYYLRRVSAINEQ